MKKSCYLKQRNKSWSIIICDTIIILNITAAKQNKNNNKFVTNTTYAHA